MRKDKMLYRLFLISMLLMIVAGGQSCIQKETPVSQPSPSSPAPQPQPQPQPAPGPTPSPQPTPPPSPPVSSGQPTLRLIVVADTNDSKIGKSVAVDSANMQQLMEDIAKASNGALAFRKIVLTGNAVSKNNLMRAVEYPAVGPNDTIVFLYSGHGHRLSSTSASWPLMDVSEGPADFSEVIQKIKSKNPRQFIALADCCNVVVDIRADRALLMRREFPRTNVAKMFVNAKSWLAASGSIPGQLSYGDDTDGGLFTYTLISNIIKALSGPETSWEQVFEQTKADVMRKSKESGDLQTPQYEKIR
jgi:hypothetical protein